MSRQTHDLINDHFGVLDDAQLATGTPASGDAPLSNGDGTRTWGPAGGGANIHLEDDDVTFAEPAVVFKDGATRLAAEGSTGTNFTAAYMDLATVQIRLQVNAGDYGYFQVSGDGEWEAYGTNGPETGYISYVSGSFIDIYCDASSGSDWAEVLVSANIGSIEMYASADVILDPDNGINLMATIINMPNLPTSDPGIPGQLWNDSGTVKVSL